MNAFDKLCRPIELQGMAILEPFLRQRADGALVVLDKGPLARALQESTGDAIVQMPNRTAYAVEIKIETENKYGNAFLETWSNKNLRNRDNHARLGSNPGWMFKLKADLLFYYFLKNDELFVFDFFKLKRWAFGGAEGNERGRIYDFPEKTQSKYTQLNDTWGRCVPFDVLRKEVGYAVIHPTQLALFAEMNDPWRAA
jgi:hypothetical protein